MRRYPPHGPSFGLMASGSALLALLFFVYVWSTSRSCNGLLSHNVIVVCLLMTFSIISMTILRYFLEVLDGARDDLREAPTLFAISRLTVCR